MKRIIFLLIYLFIFGGVISACNNEDSDKEKDVTLTIYEETGFGTPVLSDYLTEPLQFSDSDNQIRGLLINTIVEGLDFEYERGYRYTFKAKKIWMVYPPQDVSSVKYRIEELLSKEQIIKSDSEEELTLIVASETIKFAPRYRNDIENKIYDALSVKIAGTESKIAIISIEDFDYELGFEYSIKVKKTTQSEPYSTKYSLIEILSKEEK